ncbi:MAG: ankyrin repeat domain-containing protein [Kiritimatiellaeota bacterium]|nr:ankyrin repeat domain-containing protein [Kiritimatiellota bacterium]
MNKYVVTCLSIIAATTLICFFIYTQNNRFVMVNAGDGKVYKINKRTGESILIRWDKEIPVAPSKPTKEETIEERAISLAKMADTLGGSYSYNVNEIRSAIKKMTGNLKIIGWQARQADEQTFIVTYSYDNGNGVHCWAFEVKPKEDFARNITGDASLEKKYGFNTASKVECPPWEDYTAKPVAVAPTQDLYPGAIPDQPAPVASGAPTSPPPGFVLDKQPTNVLPPLPPGAVLDQQSIKQGLPPLPPGAVLDQPAPAVPVQQPLLVYETIHEAAARGDLAAIERHLQKGVDVNARDNDGKTPLCLAARWGNVDVVKYLVDKGADMNVKDIRGWTLLMVAANAGKLDIVKFLVGKGADVNAKDNVGVTPLIFAMSNGHTNVAEFLKQNLAKK